jgi:hypothetical protein
MPDTIHLCQAFFSQINSNLQLGTQKTETVEKQDRSTASVN